MEQAPYSGPLLVEDLAPTLEGVTFSTSHIKLGPPLTWKVTAWRRLYWLLHPYWFYAVRNEVRDLHVKLRWQLRKVLRGRGAVHPVVEETEEARRSRREQLAALVRALESGSYVADLNGNAVRKYPKWTAPERRGWESRTPEAERRADPAPLGSKPLDPNSFKK